MNLNNATAHLKKNSNYFSFCRNCYLPLYYTNIFFVENIITRVCNNEVGWVTDLKVSLFTWYLIPIQQNQN